MEFLLSGRHRERVEARHAQKMVCDGTRHCVVHATGTHCTRYFHTGTAHLPTITRGFSLQFRQHGTAGLCFHPQRARRRSTLRGTGHRRVNPRERLEVGGLKQPGKLPEVVGVGGRRHGHCARAARYGPEFPQLRKSQFAVCRSAWQATRQGGAARMFPMCTRDEQGSETRAPCSSRAQQQRRWLKHCQRRHECRFRAIQYYMSAAVKFDCKHGQRTCKWRSKRSST